MKESRWQILTPVATYYKKLYSIGTAPLASIAASVLINHRGYNADRAIITELTQMAAAFLRAHTRFGIYTGYLLIPIGSDAGFNDTPCPEIRPKFGADHATLDDVEEGEPRKEDFVQRRSKHGGFYI